MKVLLKFKGEDYEVNDISKAMTVRKFRNEVKKVTGVEQKHQNLYFGGKVLHDDCDLCDYKIEGGYTIILQQRQPLAEKSEGKNGSEVTPKENGEVSKPAEEEKVEETTEEKPLSPAQERERLLALGVGEDELKELGVGPDVATETSTEVKPEEPCKKCKSNPEKNCKECGLWSVEEKRQRRNFCFVRSVNLLYTFNAYPSLLLVSTSFQVVKMLISTVLIAKLTKVKLLERVKWSDTEKAAPKCLLKTACQNVIGVKVWPVQVAQKHAQLSGRNTPVQFRELTVVCIGNTGCNVQRLVFIDPPFPVLLALKRLEVVQALSSVEAMKMTRIVANPSLTPEVVDAI